MDEVRVLVMDDEEEGLDATASQVKDFFEYSGLVQLTVKTFYALDDALKCIESWTPDVCLLDLKMEKDVKTDWAKYGVEDLMQSGGFVPYFRLVSQGHSLPPTIVFYTASQTLHDTFKPFFFFVDHPDFAGRPFSIARKETRVSEIDDFVPALIAQEINRFRSSHVHLFSCETVRRALDAILREPDADLTRWRDLIGDQIAPGATLGRLFPAWCAHIANIWVAPDDSRDVEIRRLLDLISARSWLRVLNNEVLHPEKPGGTLLHGDPHCWGELADAVRLLPETTRGNLLRDLGGTSWAVPPWGQGLGAYRQWQAATEDRFKCEWREWCSDVLHLTAPMVQRNGREYRSLPAVVFSELGTANLYAQWAGAHPDGADQWRAHRECYMDPHLLADEVTEYVRAEIAPRTNANPLVWLRTILDQAACEIHLDLIANGTPPFAGKLPSTIQTEDRRHRLMAKRMLGWCQVTIYTHDGAGNIVGANATTASMLQQATLWPDQPCGAIPWDQVGCVVRWTFQLPT